MPSRPLAFAHDSLGGQAGAVRLELVHTTHTSPTPFFVVSVLWSRIKESSWLFSMLRNQIDREIHVDQEGIGSRTTSPSLARSCLVLVMPVHKMDTIHHVKRGATSSRRSLPNIRGYDHITYPFYPGLLIVFSAEDSLGTTGSRPAGREVFLTFGELRPSPHLRRSAASS